MVRKLFDIIETLSHCITVFLWLYYHNINRHRYLGRRRCLMLNQMIRFVHFFIPKFCGETAQIKKKNGFMEVQDEGHRHIPEDIKMCTCSKGRAHTLGYPGDSHAFCTLNPPVSPGVSRSSSLLGRMARWDIPGMPAACGMSEHMASLSGDNGEAEGSCPEPAGR